MVAASNHRQGSVLMGLIRMIDNALLEDLSHIRYVYIVVKPGFYHALNMMGFNYLKLGETDKWHGKKMVAAKMDVPKMDDQVLEANPPLHESPKEMEESVNIFSF